MYSNLKTNDDEKALFSKIWDSCSNMGKYIQKAFTFGAKAERTNVFGENWDMFIPKDFSELVCQFSAENRDNEQISIFDTIDADKLKNASNIKGDDDEFADDFQPLITFPTLLLHCKNIVDGRKKPEGYLDDGRLLVYFPKKELTDDFIRKYAYTLLKAKYLLDNYIIHRETDSQADDEFVLQRGHKTGDKSTEKLTPRNTFSMKNNEDVEEDNTKCVIMIQSCLRISYTSPKQMYWITELLEALFENPNDVDKIISTCEAYMKNEARKFIIPQNFVNAYQKIPGYVYFYLDYLLWKHRNEGTDIQKSIPSDYWDDFKFLFRSPKDHFVPLELEEGETYEFDDQAEWKWKHSFGNLSCITTDLNFTKSRKDIRLNREQLLQSPKLCIMETIKNKHDGKYDAKAAEEHCEKMKQILEDEIKC
jgi:hypothetical protein